MEYHHPVRTLRILAAVLYATYLVHVGLLLVLLPWSPAWAQLTATLPLPWMRWLSLPAIRGTLTALGLLHIVLLGAELIGAGNSTRTGVKTHTELPPPY